MSILTLPTVGGVNSIAGQKAIVVDTTVPTLSFSSVSAGNPGSALQPTILGTASETSNVTLYYDSGCVTSKSSSTANTIFASPGVATNANVGANTTTVIYGKAIDTALNESTCTSLVTYTHDNTAPTVTSVSSSTSDGSYKSGGVVNVTVTFSENVLFTGTPQITLETGATDDVVNFTSVSTNVATFAYTIGSGDTANDLDYVATTSLALNSGFSHMYGQTSDGTYLYVGDTNCIRRVAIADGTTTTLAGICSVSGTTDGVGAAARLGSSYGLFALNQVLYFTDTTNHTLRTIDINPGSGTFKTVTTVAGIAGTYGSTNASGLSASFFGPRGITYDGTYFYIADYSNHKIRRVDPSGWAVTTFAGTGTNISTDHATGTSASFSGPSGVVYDSGTSSLYVSETIGNTIRKIVISSTAVTTLAGDSADEGGNDGTGATCRFHSPMFITSDGTYLYVSDSGLQTNRKILLLFLRPRKFHIKSHES